MKKFANKRLLKQVLFHTAYSSIHMSGFNEETCCVSSCGQNCYANTQRVDNILNLTTFLDSDMLTIFLLVGTIKGLAFCILNFLDDNNAYNVFYETSIFSKKLLSERPISSLICKVSREICRNIMILISSTS